MEECNAQAQHAALLKSNTTPWVFFAFFKLQMVPNRATHQVLKFYRITIREMQLFVEFM